MGRAYLVSMKNSMEIPLLKFVEQKVNDTLPLGEVNLSTSSDHIWRLAEMSYYCNIIAKRLHGSNDWNEVKDKIKAIVLSIDPDTEEFEEYERRTRLMINDYLKEHRE